MSGQSSPVLLRYKRKRIPSIAIVAAVLVALLILFLWLHFALAQEIESAGREIQLKTEELHRIERRNHELRYRISIAESQRRMADRSEQLGYEPQRPVYLLLDRPLPPSTANSRPSGLHLGSIVGSSTQGNSAPQAASASLEDSQTAGRGNGE